MRWSLVYWKDEALGEAWRRHFGERPEVEIVCGDICQIKADAVVSPANSFGFMDGGLDCALSERFGWDLQERLQRQIQARPLRELLVGEALVLPTGDLAIPWLISAPTMRVPMKLRQSVNAYLSMKALSLAALQHTDSPPIQHVAVPGLGTGVGGLSPETAALQMWRAFQEVVLSEHRPPAGFGEAQRAHLWLNVKEIKIWD